MRDESNRVALVTGAGSGIGRAVAHALLSDGFSVVLAGRRLERLEASLLDSGRDGARGLAVRADVTDPTSVQTLFGRTASAFGRLDVLFNNAGANTASTPIEDIPVGQWRSVLEVNLSGAFLCTQEAIKLMKGQRPAGGRIINNGSVSAHVPRPNSAPYTVTKHGMTGLTKSTALEGRAHKIVCSQIDIGNAATDLTSRMGEGVLQADGSTRPEPTIDVRYVADAVTFIAKLPLDVNVPFLTIMATEMPLVGRG